MNVPNRDEVPTLFHKVNNKIRAGRIYLPREQNVE